MIHIFQDAPVVIVFKAMGIATDQEIMQMIGSEENVTSAFMSSFEEAQRLKVFTQLQVRITSDVRYLSFLIGYNTYMHSVTRLSLQYEHLISTMRTFTNT